MATAAELIDEIKKMSVLELSELIKALEEEFGVSATAVAAAAPAAAGARDGGAAEAASSTRGRAPPRRGRQEDPGDQGRACRDRPWPQGGQGARGRGPQAGQGGHRPRGGGEAPEQAPGGWRHRRAEVTRLMHSRCRGAAPARPLVVLARGRPSGCAHNGHMDLLGAIRARDREAISAMVADDVVFNGP